MADGDPKPIGAHLPNWIAAMRSRAAQPETAEAAARRKRWLEEQRRTELEVLREIAESRGVPIARDWELLCKRELEGTCVTQLGNALAWRSGQGAGTPLIFVLSSSPGTGKSVALRHAIVHARPSARYALSHRVSGLVEWKNEDLLKSLRSCRTLALDELGLERDPAPICQLLVERWDAGHVTILATNLGVEDLYGRLDARVIDRLEGQRADGQDWLALLSEGSYRTGQR